MDAHTSRVTVKDALRRDIAGALYKRTKAETMSIYGYPPRAMRVAQQPPSTILSEWHYDEGDVYFDGYLSHVVVREGVTDVPLS